MNKNQFQTIVDNYTSLNQEEADSLLVLLNDYPFSQLIHNLATRAAQDLSLPNYDKLLHESAVYSTDRTVLRKVMSAPRIPRMVTPTELHDTWGIPPTTSSPTASAFNLTSYPHLDDAFYSEIEDDLKNLAKSKLRFEQVVEELEKVATQSQVSPHAPKIEIDLPVRNEDLIEKTKKPKGLATYGAPKQKKQIEIIDEFIKTQPSISPAKSVLPKTEDLSEKYDILSDDLLSETLVEILIKQDKKEKAIEILKKLIWKFPQKKAYFATQIKHLKK